MSLSFTCLHAIKYLGLPDLCLTHFPFASFLLSTPPPSAGKKHFCLVQVTRSLKTVDVRHGLSFLSYGYGQALIGDLCHFIFSIASLCFQDRWKVVIIWKVETVVELLCWTSIYEIILIFFRCINFLSCNLLVSCTLKRSIEVNVFPLWVTLMDVGCYTWYQSWRLPE